MEDDKPQSEPTPAASPGAGAQVRAARTAAGIDPAKLCADLRISTAALEALEAGQYDRLPGEPYVRALLVSLARYLGLDAHKLVQAYQAEIGVTATSAPITPYKDLSQNHVLAHKQIFILLLAVLLFAMLLILGKINSSGGKAAATKSRAADTTSVVPPPDTLPDADSLLPPGDSADEEDDSVAAIKPAPPPIRNRVVVKPRVDSVWIRVLLAGKPETDKLLTLGKQMEVVHDDTITMIIGKHRGVILNFADTTVIPARKRFRIIGKRISYF